MLYQVNPTADQDPIGYQTGLKTSTREIRTFEPVVIAGDIETFQAGYDLIHFQNKDTRFVLSYHPNDNPTLEESACDVAITNKMGFAGLEADEYISVALLHRQQWDQVVRADIHLDWLNLHLPSGLSYNPYYHRSDFVRFDLTKQLINFVRGYGEPSSPEHSRVFGTTTEGTESNKLEKVVQEIRKARRIEHLEQLAPELELRGYKVHRRKDGRLRGSKSITATAPSGTDTRLFFVSTSRKSWLLTNPLDNSEEQLERLLARLNRMCLKKAKKNWFCYSARLGLESEDQAKQNGYGFVPFTIRDLMTKENYEQNKRRDRIFNPRSSQTVTGRKQDPPGSTVRVGKENSRFVDPRSTFREVPSSPNPRKRSRECREEADYRDFDRAIEEASAAARNLRIRLATKAWQEIIRPGKTRSR